MFLHRIGKVHAPEFPGRRAWLNSPALKMSRLKGKIVLIDFWTYSCVNCLRTLPYLKKWHERYKDQGLVIIGVHTPEFKFEGNKKEVVEAVKRLEIPYPVVLDSDYAIWKAYTNKWWPRKFLVDHHGIVIYDHVGEGGYAETEQAIQKALQEIGAEDLPDIEPDMSVGGNICYRTTPERYLGFLRAAYGNAQQLIPNEEVAYTDEKEYIDDKIYLHGHWNVTGEYAQHSRKTAIHNEYLALKYGAFSVNLVMTTEKGGSARLELELDGQPLPEDMAGKDVRVQKDGRTIVTVREARMYNLVDSDTYHRGVLKIKTKSDNVRMYAFTFGGCK